MALVNAKAELESKVNSQAAELAVLAADLRVKSDDLARLSEEAAGLRKQTELILQQLKEARNDLAATQERARTAEARATSATAGSTAADAIAAHDAESGAQQGDVVALEAVVAQARQWIATLEGEVRWRNLLARGFVFLC